MLGEIAKTYYYLQDHIIKNSRKRFDLICGYHQCVFFHNINKNLKKTKIYSEYVIVDRRSNNFFGVESLLKYSDIQNIQSCFGRSVRCVHVQ